MQYINGKVYEQFHNPGLNKAVYLVMVLVDTIVQIYSYVTGEKYQFFVTSVYRPDDPGYHGKWQACDGDIVGQDTDEWPTTLMVIVGPVLTVLRGFCSKIQFQFHSSPKYHLHLEYDDSSIKK